MLAATIIWGSSFTVTKWTVGVIPPFTIIALRFSIAAVLLAIIFHRRLKKIDKGYLISGLVIGLCLFSAFAFQTRGISMTMPGKNAFLTAIYCVAVPFIFWIVTRKKPDAYNFIAAFVCIVGIGFVSLQGDLSIEPGDVISLIGGVLFAAHIVSIAICARERDPIVLTILQFGVAAGLGWVASFAFEDFSWQSVTPAAWGGMLYLAVFATGVGLLLQNIGQKFVPPSAAAIILSMESIFGVVFSMIFYGEQVTPRLLVGFALIFLAVIISETKLSFFRKKQKEPAQSEIGG